MAAIRDEKSISIRIFNCTAIRPRDYHTMRSTSVYNTFSARSVFLKRTRSLSCEICDATTSSFLELNKTLSFFVSHFLYTTRIVPLCSAVTLRYDMLLRALKPDDPHASSSRWRQSFEDRTRSTSTDWLLWIHYTCASKLSWHSVTVLKGWAGARLLFTNNHNRPNNSRIIYNAS